MELRSTSRYEISFYHFNPQFFFCFCLTTTLTSREGQETRRSAPTYLTRESRALNLRGPLGIRFIALVGGYQWSSCHQPRPNASRNQEQWHSIIGWYSEIIDFSPLAATSHISMATCDGMASGKLEVGSAAALAGPGRVSFVLFSPSFVSCCANAGWLGRPSLLGSHSNGADAGQLTYHHTLSSDGAPLPFYPYEETLDYTTTMRRPPGRTRSSRLLL
jgi:hypothetical protein